MFWKVKIVFVVYLFISGVTFSQDAELDSLKKAVDTAPHDTLKVNALLTLAANYCLTEPAKATTYAARAENLATKIDYKKGIALSYKWLGIANYYQSNYYNALVYSNKSLSAFESLNDNVGASNILNNIGAFYSDKGEESKALEYYLKSLKLAQQSGNKLRLTSSLTNIGVLYSKNPATSDKALQYYQEALPLAKDLDDAGTVGTIYSNIGELQLAKSNFPEALESFKLAIEVFDESPQVAYAYNDMGKLYTKLKNYDTALYYFGKGLQIAKESALQVDLAGSYMGIAQVHVGRRQDGEAITAYKKAIEILEDNDSSPELKKAYDGISEVYLNVGDLKNAHLYEDKLNQLYKEEYKSKLDFTTATFDYSMELQAQASQLDKLIKENELRELALEREKLYKNASIAILITVLIISVVLLFIIRQRKRLNTILYNQKDEIERQKISVETALADLKSAQSQLIHSEKMASLGELTAGIAHEIQNPLNFVNNFSEVSKELILELQEELEAGNTEDVMDIISSIVQNLQKINHHGKRADAIVKGMLQHSRGGTGSKEPTNINAIAEEYARLAYLGLRAKDNAIKPILRTDFDKNIGDININTADIGRVIVNLVSNAFYAIGLPAEAGSDRAKQEPTVWISTKRRDEKVLLTIRDNGPGIPKKVLDKIFQPFFTTKPTGQGTGLGLSLSYDIARAHGGEILVDTEEGKGTSFTIVLPAA